MKIITADEITAAVKGLCVPANVNLPGDIAAALRTAYDTEQWELAKATLGTLCDNSDVAQQTGLPICQDTGKAVKYYVMKNWAARQSDD